MSNALETTSPVTKETGTSRLSRAWSALRQGVLGSQHDFTEGSIGKAITLLAIPMVLEMSMESLFGIVDVFFVARLGADSIAAVGITDSMLTIVFAVAIGLSMATTAMVARRIGEKDPAGASVAAIQAIMIGIAVSVPISIVGLLFTRDLFRLMGASEAVISTGTGYGTIILGGNLIVQLLFLINGVFRGAGDASIAMRVLWVSNVINIILDPCLIFGIGPFPEMGVTGAAVATNIGRGVGVFYQLYTLFSGRSRVKARLSDVRVDLKVMTRLIRVSVGGVFQFLVATASWLALVRIVAIFGSAALAGYQVALRIIIFAILPSWGMSNAAATLVGQNLGAGKPQRAERSVWVTGFSNMVFLGCVTVVFIAFAEPLVRFFTTEPEVVPYGVAALRYISYGYVFYAYGMVMVCAFNGAGDTTTPTYINLGCYWLLQIPLAYGLSLPGKLGATGVFLAITVAESILAVVGILAFRRGRWKKQRI